MTVRSISLPRLSTTLFETIDENMEHIDAAYDHYAQTLQSALNGDVEYMLIADYTKDRAHDYASL